MGVFGTIWEYIKKAAKGIYNFFKKIFSVLFEGVKFTITCILAIVSLLENSWVGKVITGIKLIYELVKFFKSKGAKVDESYKEKIQDMQVDYYGEHQFNINVSA